ncbi:C-terminal binding protein [Actinoplanes sp. NPDC048967]|uniref:C-terminal binding protein n=1 Tax=Actinoplanes sp. NPDC048967 TaxID=3155269 RepID=UPI0033C55CF0
MVGLRVVYTDPAWAVDETGSLRPDRAELERGILGPGISVELGPFDTGYVLAGEQLHQAVKGADALVVYRCQVTPELLEAAGPGCRVIARSGVGIDNLNGELLRRSGVYGFHIPDYCGDEVSTHTLALLLALERGICVQDRLVRADEWGIHRGQIPRRAADRVAGIVGFGRIGRATTRKLQPFYRRVLAHDPYVPADLMASHGVDRVDRLTELFERADAVILHAALTAETRDLVNTAVLAAARPGTLLVNSARGGLVDLAAVLAALSEGRLGGYASDVFSPEDPNRSETGRRLLARDDVVVSSHRAFLSHESELSLRRRVAAGVRAVLVGGTPPPEGQVA